MSSPVDHSAADFTRLESTHLQFNDASSHVPPVAAEAQKIRQYHQ